jgi:hypothetical protein
LEQAAGRERHSGCYLKGERLHRGIDEEVDNVDEIRVSSWNQLNDCLYEDAWREEIGRFRLACAFRGTSDASHDLTTSVKRLGGSTDELEDIILRAFRRYAGNETVPDNSMWNWLALAQHHGLPTRLLDWTYSPLVATHFTTENTARFDTDGVIWRVDLGRVNALLPERLKAVLAEEEETFVFTAEMLNRAAATLRDFDLLADTPFVVFFEPPSLDQRIVNQYALFSLMSDPDISLNDWLQDHSDVVRRIVIPTDLKWEVRDKLDQANITERVLYPGLDGLSQWLKRYYTPRLDRSDTARRLPTEEA